MKVYPKIGNSVEGLLLVRDYVKDGLEVQMLSESDDLINLVGICKKECTSIKEVTIHTVIRYCFIETYLSSEQGYKYVKSRINDCLGLSKVLKIRVNLLFHCRTRFELLQRSLIIEKLQTLADMLLDSDVHILIENDVCRVDDFTSLCHAYNLVTSLNHSHIKMCLDLCHLQCTANLMQVSRLATLSYFDFQRLSDVVHQVHFSVAGNGDGFKDQSTHSLPHTEEELVADLDWLSILGLSDTILVSEIREKDYKTRLSQKQELKLLDSYFKLVKQ